jgi:hypothetical protein
MSSSAGTKANIYVPGTASIDYARVADSDACSTTGGLTTTNGIDGGNTVCWTFQAAGANMTQLHYIFRLDDGTEAQANPYGTEDTPLSGIVWKGDRVRLRTTISNTGTGDATNIAYRLQYASSSCSSWSDVGSWGSTLPLEWLTDLSQYLPNNAPTTDYSRLSNPNGKSFVSGYGLAGSNQTSAHTLTNAQFTENEYSIVSTALAQASLTYCFRLTNGGSVTNFTFSKQPQIILRPDGRPQGGGPQGSEGNPGQGSQRTGGGQGGGQGGEGTGSGGQKTGGGQGGGGGDAG